MSGEILPKDVMSEEEARKIAEKSAIAAANHRADYWIETGAGGIVSQSIEKTDKVVIVEFWNGEKREPRIVGQDDKV